jgi:hypothetical protein
MSDESVFSRKVRCSVERNEGASSSCKANVPNNDVIGDHSKFDVREFGTRN